MDDCIGCDQCSRACPVSCIEIETVKSIPGEDLRHHFKRKKKALWVTKFDIDIAKCCYCQLCVFPCPTECIYMTDVYEFAEFERSNFLYKFATLTDEEAAQKKLNYEKMQAEKEAQNWLQQLNQNRKHRQLLNWKIKLSKYEKRLYEFLRHHLLHFRSDNFILCSICCYNKKHCPLCFLSTYSHSSGVAGIYVLLGADFIAISQIMVYVGGILILFLFGVMLNK